MGKLIGESGKRFVQWVRRPGARGPPFGERDAQRIALDAPLRDLAMPRCKGAPHECELSEQLGDSARHPGARDALLGELTKPSGELVGLLGEMTKQSGELVGQLGELAKQLVSFA